MKQRHANGRYRINYFDRVFPVIMMVFLASVCFGLQKGNEFEIQQVQAGGSETLVTVDQPVKVQVSPTPTPQLKVTELIMPTVTPTPTNSDYIELAVDEFLPKRRSESLMIMHCLAHRESGHGASTAHGDNGLAGGPFQFHQATWLRMRKQMGEPESSRYDFKEAARTTAWAIANGRALEWGPILRASQGGNFAACPKPSWY